MANSPTREQRKFLKELARPMSRCGYGPSALTGPEWSMAERLADSGLVTRAFGREGGYVFRITDAGRKALEASDGDR